MGQAQQQTANQQTRKGGAEIAKECFHVEMSWGVRRAIVGDRAGGL
jgi:hypothetical protein